MRGNLSTNGGEIAANWALDGHGILMRAGRENASYLRRGRLAQDHPTRRHMRAFSPSGHHTATRLRAFADTPPPVEAGEST